MSDPSDQPMAQVLAEMSVISEQRAASYDKDRVHGGEQDRAPAPLTDKPMVDYYRDRYNRAHGPSSRRAILTEALEALEVARHAPTPDEPDLAHPRWPRWVAESPLPSVEIARKYSVSRQYVHQIRRKFGSQTEA